jgi:alkanesulfonate monooxygenase SsuD/methylene tetrahydromethanopterin reductase-like flavin-dependent oxidoreductase (luciferase family)
VPSAESTASAARKAWGLARPGLGLSLGGIHGPDQTRSHRAWVESAESLGLHSVWLPEMHFQPGVCPAPLVELAAYAATTSRLRLGTTSLLLPLHPPEKIAAEIATLDQLSQGRLLIGLGRGFQKPMLEAFGVPPAEKRDRFDDALDRILALWAEHNGRPARSPLQTHQRPHPPLAVAAFGPKGLAQAARRNLPYLASPVETFDQIADNLARHRSLLPNPEKPALSLVMRTIFVSEDPSELDAARESLSLEMAGRRKGMPAAVNEALDAPLAARAVVGTVTEVIERLTRERRRLGIDLLVARPQLNRIDRDTALRSVVRLTEEVWPAVQADAAAGPVAD